MAEGNKGGVYGGQPVDITVHVRREGGGPQPGRAGDMGAVSPGGTTSRAPSGGPPPATPRVPRGLPEQPYGQGEDKAQRSMRDIKDANQGFLQLAKKWLPALAGVTTMAGIIKKSSIFGSTMEIIMDLIGMIVDVILIPFLLPILKLIKPILPPLAKLINWLVKTFMGSAEKEMKDAGMPKWAQKVAGVFDKIPGGSLMWKAGEAIAGKPGEKWGTGGSLVDKAIRGMGSLSGALSGILGGIGIHQSGLSYQPKTALGVIHRGERVLNAREARNYNLGNTAGSGTFFNKFDIHVSNNVDAALLDQRIVDRLERRLGNRYRRS